MTIRNILYIARLYSSNMYLLSYGVLSNNFLPNLSIPNQSDSIIRNMDRYGNRSLFLILLTSLIIHNSYHSFSLRERKQELEDRRVDGLITRRSNKRIVQINKDQLCTNQEFSSPLRLYENCYNVFIIFVQARNIPIMYRLMSVAFRMGSGIPIL